MPFVCYRSYLRLIIAGLNVFGCGKQLGVSNFTSICSLFLRHYFPSSFLLSVFYSGVRELDS